MFLSSLQFRLILFVTTILTLILFVVVMLPRFRGLRLFGPVLFYDLLRTSRRGRNILLRCLFAAGVLIVFCFAYDDWFQDTLSSRWRGEWFQQEWSLSLFSPVKVKPEQLEKLGLSLFSSFMIFQFAAIFLLTPAFTAGAIAEEKERRTLEYLLTTDLHDHEIILSKLVARVAMMLLLLLTGLPILALTQLLGGVDPNMVLAGFAAAAMTVISLGSLSLLLSVYSKKPMDAIMGTYFHAALFLAVTACPVLNWGNILVALYRVDDGFHSKAPEDRLGLVLIEYLIFHVLMTLICIRWASVRLRPVTLASATNPELLTAESSLSSNLARSQPSAAETNHVAELIEKVLVRDLPPMLDRPMEWKEYYVNANRNTVKTEAGKLIVALWWSFLALSCIWFLILSLTGKLQGKDANDIFSCMTTGLAGLSFLLVGLAASSRVSKEREQQTLDSLLTTLLDRKEILWAKLLGSFREVRMIGLILPPICLLGVFSLGLNIFALPLQVFAIASLALFSGILGLFFSTYCKTSTRAMICTMLTLTALSIVPVVFFSMPELSPPGIVWSLFLGYQENAIAFDRNFMDRLYRDISRVLLALIMVFVYLMATWSLWKRTCKSFDKEAGSE